MKQTIRLFAGVCAAIVAVVFGMVVSVGSRVADSYTVPADCALEFANEPLVPVGQGDVSTGAVSGGQYNVTLSLFGLIPVKQVDVTAAQREYVTPCGTPFGIKLFTDGVLVVGTTSVHGESGRADPAAQAGIAEGDIIVAINGERVRGNEDVARIMEESGGREVSVELRRRDKSYNVKLAPVKSEESGKYMAGLWVRDSTAGIGTMTFYDSGTMTFAGLGHAVCDADTGELLPLMSGEIVNAKITGVTKGNEGIPGELQGYFADQTAIGTLTLNNEQGVYGELVQAPVADAPIPVAFKQEVTAGSAEIIATIDDSGPQRFSCVIEKLNSDTDTPTKNMVVLVTDRRLIEATGGIVQGMSGSPIIQNGRLVGAVTHVFVNDPERGYGIFAENMLRSHAETALQKAA